MGELSLHRPGGGAKFASGEINALELSVNVPQEIDLGFDVKFAAIKSGSASYSGSYGAFTWGGTAAFTGTTNKSYNVTISGKKLIITLTYTPTGPTPADTLYWFAMG